MPLRGACCLPDSANVRPQSAAMSDWFFQECIEAAQEPLLLSAIASNEVGIEDRDCVDRTPLMVAIEYDRLELARTLLSMGADPSSASNDGETCLSRAVESGNTELLTLLLKSGADIEQIGQNFLTPLSLAAVRGDNTTIEFLLGQGADIEARGEMEETPLIEASYFGNHTSVLCLLKYGAARSAMDTFGRTALEVAMEQNHSNVVAVLTGHAV